MTPNKANNVSDSVTNGCVTHSTEIEALFTTVAASNTRKLRFELPSTSVRGVVTTILEMCTLTYPSCDVPAR